MDALTISTIIYGGIALFLALISVITVFITIKQNNKMLESSTRPYITICFDYTNFGEPIGYFVIRNFGNSSGKIISLTYNDVVKKQPTSLSNVTIILDRMVGNSIAPNQKFLIPLKLIDTPDGTCVFDISYCAFQKTYTEHVEICMKQYVKLSKTRINYAEQKPISYPLQEIAERLM